MRAVVLQNPVRENVNTYGRVVVLSYMGLYSIVSSATLMPKGCVIKSDAFSRIQRLATFLTNTISYRFGRESLS